MDHTDNEHRTMGNALYNGDDAVVERPDVLNSVDGNGVDLDRRWLASQTTPCVTAQRLR